MSSPLLCDVIAVRTMAELRAARDAAADADVVELRLDMVERPDVAGALQGRRKPVIVTCRAAWEGGHFTGAEEDRQRLLREALEAGAEYVDVEWRAEGVEQWLRPVDRPRVIRSLHDFTGMPADLAGLVREMRGSGAGVVKVAGTAAALRDLLPLIEIGRAQAPGERTVLIGMGERGVASRILAAHVGSAWTYAGSAVAPGQIDGRRLLEEFRFRRVTSATPVYAVVGQPIAHSISPAMHNAAFAAAGLDAVYIPCDAADFDDFLALAEVLPIVGASVTAPFKLAACEHSRAMDEDVRRVGAVNTLRRSGGGWEGRNTDVAGFLAPLEPRLTLRGARAAVLGTGGAARGVVAGLGAAGARVTVHARNQAAGAEVAALAAGRVAGWAVEAGSWDLLVNTTPIGTYPDVDETPFAGPFDSPARGVPAPGGAAPTVPALGTAATGAAAAGAAAAAAAAGVPAAGAPDAARVVYDLIYNPRPTRLLREAAAAGCVTLDGLDMLVEQAVRQFAWWTGRSSMGAVMRAAALRRLDEMAREARTHGAHGTDAGKTGAAVPSRR